MNVVEAFKRFVKCLTGDDIVGDTIDEVMVAGSAKCINIKNIDATAIKYTDSTNTSFVLNSSTEDSVKKFNITVTDDGTIAATEIVAAEE